MLKALFKLLQWTAFCIVGYALIGEGDKVVLIGLMSIVTVVAGRSSFGRCASKDSNYSVALT